ncbi:MAG: hypothetical protein QXT84_06315 [Candidatus Bathyarchaeia archaeon]
MGNSRIALMGSPTQVPAAIFEIATPIPITIIAVIVVAIIAAILAIRRVRAR